MFDVISELLPPAELIQKDFDAACLMINLDHETRC